MRTSSRYHRRSIGANVVTALQLVAPHPGYSAPTPASDAAVASGTFSQPTTVSTSCPPGYHWVDDGPAASSVRGISACVPDAASPATAATLPAPATSAGAPATAATCPAPWPLWWLLVAAGVGAFAGGYAKRDRKAMKRNAGRIVVNAGSRAIASLF